MSAGTEDPRRVLVVEDDGLLREALLLALARRGFEARGAADGRAAYQEFFTFYPRYAVVDLGLPVLDGLRLARMVRVRPAGRGAVLVALTARYGAAAERAAAAAGFDALLTKPAELEAVVAALRR
jgi:DNA-binding response OmpR family regulator